MKYPLVFICGVVLIASLSGCDLITSSTPPTPAGTAVPEVPVVPAVPVVPDVPLVATTKAFNGTYFAIDYPSNFTVRPSGPLQYNDAFVFVETDEAYFTSPDGAVEFYVYSPQWGGEPADYLVIKPTETLVNKSEDPLVATDSVIVRATVRANDNSYLRSWESTPSTLDSGTELHKVFGIRYRDQAAYAKYKEQYLAFKKSLQQFAD